MATQKQIDANRSNALRSTSPKTPAGKTISSRNTLKHGLRARAALLPGEDKQAFQRLFNASSPTSITTKPPPQTCSAACDNLTSEPNTNPIPGQTNPN
jgi:hypothetical protein